MVDKYYYAELGDDGKLKNPSVGYGNSGPIMSDANAQGKDLSIKKPTPKRRRGGGSSPQPSIIETSSSQVSDSYVKPEERMSIAKPQQPPTLNQQQLNAVRNNSPPPLSVNPAKPPALDNQGYVKPSIKMLFTNPKVFLNTLRIQRNPAKTEELRQKIQQGYGYTQGGTLLNTQINVNQLSPQQAKYYADYYSGVPVSLAGSTTESKVNQVAYSLNQNIQNKVESDLSPVYQEKVNSYNNALQESVNSGMLPIDKAKEMQSQYLNQINNEYQQEVRNKTQSEYNLRITQETNNILASSKLGNEVNTQYTAGEKIRDYGNLALLGSAPFVPSNALLVLGGTTAAAGYLTKSKPIQELGFNALLGGGIGKIPLRTTTKTLTPQISTEAGDSYTLVFGNAFRSSNRGIIRSFNPETKELIEQATIQGEQAGLIVNRQTRSQGAFGVVRQSKPNQAQVFAADTKASFGEVDDITGISQGTAESKIIDLGTANLKTGEVIKPKGQKVFDALSNIKTASTPEVEASMQLNNILLTGTESKTATATLTDIYGKEGVEIIKRQLSGSYGRVFNVKSGTIGEDMVSGSTKQVRSLKNQASATTQAQQQQVTQKVIDDMSKPFEITQTENMKNLVIPKTSQQTKQEDITGLASVQTARAIEGLNLQERNNILSPVVSLGTNTKRTSKQSISPIDALSSNEMLGLASLQTTSLKQLQPTPVKPRTAINTFTGYDFLGFGGAAPIPLSYGTEQYRGSSGRKKGRKPKYTADLGSAFFGSKSKVSRKYKKLLDETTFTGLEFRGLLD